MKMDKFQAKPGGGPYDEAARLVVDLAGADAVLLIVQKGDGPAGWTLEVRRGTDAAAAREQIPRMLRELADQIERSR